MKDILCKAFKIPIAYKILFKAHKLGLNYPLMIKWTFTKIVNTRKMNLQAENNLAKIFTQIISIINSKSRVLIWNVTVQTFQSTYKILTGHLHILIICKKRDSHLQISIKTHKMMIKIVINKQFQNSKTHIKLIKIILMISKQLMRNIWNKILSKWIQETKMNYKIYQSNMWIP